MFFLSQKCASGNPVRKRPQAHYFHLFSPASTQQFKQKCEKWTECSNNNEWSILTETKRNTEPNCRILENMLGSKSRRLKLLGLDFTLRAVRHKKGFRDQRGTWHAEWNLVFDFYSMRACRSGQKVERKVTALKLNPGNILVQVKLLHYFYESISPHTKLTFYICKIRANPYL